MKLFLFGGARAQDGHADIDKLMKLIEATIRKTWVRQFFHIPFARTIATEVERDGDWFNRNIHIEGLEYLNASNPYDIAKIDKPLILISGWAKDENLLENLDTHPILVQLIRNAEYIIGESSWCKILWSYIRVTERSGQLVPWLWIIKDCILEPHYIEKQRETLLEEEISTYNVRYGIGIDSDTGIEIDLDTFPEYTTIWDGIVEIKVNPNK